MDYQLKEWLVKLQVIKVPATIIKGLSAPDVHPALALPFARTLPASCRGLQEGPDPAPAGGGLSKPTCSGCALHHSLLSWVCKN